MARRWRLPLLLALFACGVLYPSLGWAQLSGGPIDLQLFRPAIDSKGLISLNTSTALGHLEPSIGLFANYARMPLALSANTPGVSWCASGRSDCQPGDADYLLSRYDVQNMLTGNLQVALGLWKFAEIGVGLPITWWNGDTSPNPVGGENGDNGAISGQGLGDMSINIKTRILDAAEDPIGIALLGSLYLPTGDEEKFLGSGRLGVDPSLIVDTQLFDGRLTLAINVGARLRSASKRWTDLRQCNLPVDSSHTSNCATGAFLENEHDFIYGAGLSLVLMPSRLDFIAEWVGQTGFSDFADADKLNSASEIHGGFKVHFTNSAAMLFGFGRGVRTNHDNHQYGSPDVRAFLAFIFEPLNGTGDRDEDGVTDENDKCPDVKEDRDGFQDDDGCPDLDNDRDGILDAKDKCPDQPETINSFEDQDGCPDVKPPPAVVDTDGDKIPDPLDKCPKEPEDMDGFEDQDGCPDVDNDKDLILDHDDKCPNEAEVVNGFEDEDGCPDQGKVIVHKDRIEILEKIFFQTNKAKIKPESFDLLNQIAATIKGHPQILLVEIGGHADERGNDKKNLKLTDARAHAVRTYLIEQGVEAGRLEAKGYGETKPLVQGHNEEAWSQNRRVEFIILKQQLEEVQTPGPAPTEVKPAEQKPTEQKPAEQKSAEQKSAEQKPAEQKSAPSSTDLQAP